MTQAVVNTEHNPVELTGATAPDGSEAGNMVIGGAGVSSGGQKVFDVDPITGRNLISWMTGDTDTFETLTVAVSNNSLITDISKHDPNARSIIVINEDGVGIDFDYVVYFSRNIAGDDPYLVASATAVTATPININLPASLGYDSFCYIDIIPAVGQAGTELNFKIYINAKGG